MFSASISEGGPATATRSRRRQRPLSSESHPQQPKAKRQRLPLTEQTFVNPDAPQEPDAIAKKPEKVPVAELKNDNIENLHHTPRKDVSVRAKKTKHSDRAANKGDGSLVLTSTNAYTVSKLPALPDRLRTDISVDQHGEIFSSGYALALTSTHAIVWPYTSLSQSPETFTFTLPSNSRPGDPLPVGSLVSPSASSTEPGLVVVMAGTGKVVYWESISSAATFAFIKKDRSGVEYSISGMSSGEKVVAITNAESAGFILTFNSGRLAYLNVRDSHGRPSISVQFLRTAVASSGSGIFGSIRHAFSHLSLRGDIAAVRADRSARIGERNIVALGTKGKLQAWRIHRGGHNEPLGESEMKEDIVSALREADPVSAEFPPDSFEALDLTFVPKGLEPKYLELSRLSDAMATDDSTVQHLLLLVALTDKNKSRYALVEVVLTSQGCHTGMVRPITSYSTPYVPSEATAWSRPRIYLPRPALVAFVVFDRAAIMASVAAPPESPDSQLQSDSHILPASFEDVVDFRDDKSHDIIGSGFEEMPALSAPEETRTSRNKTRNPSAVLLVRGAGVVRFITTDVDKFASEQPPVVSAKNKLEQAVFFGAKQENPLVFDGRQEIKFSNEETCRAAIEVSNEILSSTTGYISTLPAHLEDNLRARSHALERLMRYLNNINAQLDRKTRWELLFNAEKMHVATMLWKLHETFTSLRPADNKKSLIGSIVEFIHQDQKHNPVANIGEVDRVRHWFINDVFRLELFVAWAYEVIKVLYKDRLLDDAQVTLMLHEAEQINISSHRAAIEFRKNNLQFYGLGQENIKMGLLTKGYDGLPEPWTGCHFVANNIKRLAELATQWVENHRDTESKPRTATTPDPKIVAKISKDLPNLVDAMLASILEHGRWSATQPSPDQKKMAQDFAKAYQEDRYKKPIALAHAGFWDHASRIAKKYDCLSGLAVILLDHIEKLELDLASPGVSPSEKQNLRGLRETKKSELENNLTAQGEDFAFPLYDYLLEKHGIEAVLEFDLDKIGFKTKFLRSKPELAKVSWINDVQQEHDVHHAAETLVELALMKEQQVWNKKIELSLGKLALLAEAEDSSKSLQLKADEARRAEAIGTVDKELIAIKIQDQLFNHVFPSTFEAVDESAAVNLAIEAHSGNIPKRQKALQQVFEEGMKRLLKHEALDAMTLIDLLTLVSFHPESGSELIASPFWMAWKVADSCCHSDEVKDAKSLIWRRLLIRDPWGKINDTQLKNDVEVSLRLAQTELFEMLADCIRYQDVREPFRPMPPRDALGAFTKDLDRRFRDFDADFQTKLKDAMKWEDKTLTQHLEKHRLGEWVKTTFEAAQFEVQNDIDETTRIGAESQNSANVNSAAVRPLFGQA